MRTVTINIPKEIKIWLLVFACCNLLNAISIYVYKTCWKELYTQLGFVFTISCLFYLIVTLIRIIFAMVKNEKMKE